LTTTLNIATLKSWLWVTARQFFKIRLWHTDQLVRLLQDYYEKLSDTMEAEIPLKRVWMLVQEED